MKKRVVSLLMALVLLLSLLPVSAMAAGGDWTYDASAGTLTQGDIVLNVTADGENLTVTGHQSIDSDTLDLTGDVTDAGGTAYTITTIGESAFERCAGLRSIVLPDGLTGINYNAFYNCTGLQSIHIPESVTFIGEYAFYLCSRITSVVIPSGITILNEGLFSGCSSLSLIVLPEGLTTINHASLSSCPALTELTLPASVTSISDTAFSYSGNLSTLTLLSATPVSNLASVLDRVENSISSIRVPDSSVGTYREALAGSSYADKVQGIGSGAVLSVNPASLTFPDAELGYTPASCSVYITNSGSQAATLSDVKLTGANAECFQIIRGLSATSVELGQTVNLALAPVSGLTSGTYTANVEITIQGDADSITVPVSFKVNYPSDARTIKAGDVELTGASTMPAYATTDASTGAVTAQPTYTETSNWNIKWDGSTLTLRNAHIKGSNYYGILYQDSAPLTILLEGGNTVSAGNGYGSYHPDSNGGIIIYNYNEYSSSDLTIKEAKEGSSLTVYGGNINDGTYVSVSAGIMQYTGRLIIESGTVDAVGGTITDGNTSTTKVSCGVYNIPNDVEVKGGKLIAKGSSTDDVKGCGLYNSLTISGGEVTIQGDTCASYSSIKLMPGDGKMIVATAGSDAGSATQIAGSPFFDEIEVNLSDKQYAHFTTEDATLMFKGSYSIPEGTLGTTYTMETPLQAMGGVEPYRFSIAAQPAAGTLTINDQGCLVYEYPSNPTEATTATIQVTDGSGETATTTVPIGAAKAQAYTLTVENGTGSGTYAAEETVTITANDQGGKQFKAWTTAPAEDIGYIDDANAQTTTLTMPAHDLTVTAEYADSVAITLKNGEQTITEYAAAGGEYTMPGKPEEFEHTDGKVFVGWIDGSQNFYAVGSKLDIPAEDAPTYSFTALWGASVSVGGKELAGHNLCPAYATTDANTGAVTVQPTYTDSDPWNIKWNGSTLTLQNAVVKSEGGTALSGNTMSTITLFGSNEVTANGGSGIYTTNIILTINGSGSLTVNAALTDSNSAGIYAANLTVADTVSALSVFTTGEQGAVISAERISFEGSSTELELGKAQGQTFLLGTTSAQKALPAEEVDNTTIVIRDSNGNERVQLINSKWISEVSDLRQLSLTSIIKNLDDADCNIHIYPTRPQNTVLVTIQDAVPGTGESMTYLLQAGSEFIMPECSYTAPQDMVFDSWVDVSDSKITYDAGATVNITEDTVFEPQWKTKPPVITVKTDPDVGATFGVIELEDPQDDWSQMTPEPLVGGQYTMQDAENTVILVCYFGSEWVLDSVDYVKVPNVTVGVTTVNSVLISTDSDIEVTINFREAQGLVVGNVTLPDDDVPVYATTDASTGAVTVQPNYKESDNWNIKWDGSTLTLRGANIKGVTQADGNAYGIYSEKNLAVVLEGANTVTGGDAANYTNSVSAGIYSIGSIAFSGSGSLTAQGANGCLSVGIMSHNALTFAGPMQVTATGADINIDPDSLDKGPGASSILGSYVSAGFVGLGSVSIESGAVVNAAGGDYTLQGDGDQSSSGCFCNILTVDGGTLVTESGEAGHSSGISCTSTIEVRNGELQAHGQQAGIDEGNRMVLYEGSKVTASAEDVDGGAVSLLDGVYVYPTEGYAVQILAGTSQQDAQEIEGSPFTTEGKVSLPDGVTWFQSAWIEHGQHKHTLELKFDESGHWEKCECGYQTAKVDHVLRWKYSEIEHWQECECGYKTAVTAHTLKLKYDESGHWQECTCGYKTAVTAHTPGEWVVLTPATDNTPGLECRRCTACGYQMETRVIPATGGEQGQGGSVVRNYGVDVEQPNNGSISVWPRSAAADTVITIIVKADEGYILNELVVTDSTGRELDLQYKDGGKYTFTMPASQVEIRASFRELYTGPLPFADVAENTWYAEAVRYVYEHGLMDGTGVTTFAPNATTSRAMIATILWRMAGSPVVNYTMKFSDVAQGRWYSEAIRWAASEGIVDGYDNGKFGTSDPITREQFAAMLWRYAKSEGYDVSVGEDSNILSYTDAVDVSEYAIPAMQWACGAGIINGTGDGSALSPQGAATRAQTAMMLMRFCEKYVKW